MTDDILEVDSANLAFTSHPIMVLLVDDQAMIAEALRRMIADVPDVDMHYVQHPQEALKTAGQVKPTVILLDLIMPDIDGLTLLRYMRANPTTKDIPVVVLSSKEEPVLKAKAFAEGANDYLVKWPDEIELVARIRYHSQSYITQVQRDQAYRALRVSQRQLAEKNLELQRLAQVDGLTGVSNRRFLDEMLESEWRRAQRDKDWLTVVMMDIDHFKNTTTIMGISRATKP